MGALQACADLVMWKNQLHSGLVAGIGLAFFWLVGVRGWSSISFLCYAALIQLVARLVYRNGVDLLAEAKVVQRRPVPVAPDVFVTEEEVREHLTYLTARANGALRLCFSLAVCENNALSLKCIAAVFAVSLIANLLGTTFLCFMVFACAFTLPIGYRRNEAEVRKLQRRATSTATELYATLLTKIPKAADVADEKKKL